jgi:AccI restriction endonuclease
MTNQMSLFDEQFSVPVENTYIIRTGQNEISWDEFLLNPRWLRGSDFLMRWLQGSWSEKMLNQAINNLAEYFAISYGPSGTAPDNDVRATELYMERLEAAGLGKLKRPDLLLFRRSDQQTIDAIIESIGGLEELPFTDESHPAMQELLTKAFLAVECENSLWLAKKMPDYKLPLKPMRRLDNKLGLKKNAVTPSVFVKEQDRKPLLDWQTQHNIPIHVWQTFFDLAFGISLERVEELINDSLIQPTQQTFQAAGGATTKKIIYKIYYHYAYSLAEVVQEPELLADHIEDKNGHILPFVRFNGGKMELKPEAIEILQKIAGA